MAYVTYQDYETYADITLEAAVQTYLTDSLIPEAEELIYDELGYYFKITAETKKELNPRRYANGRKMIFPTFTHEITLVEINGVTVDVADWVELGDGPYYGVELTDSSGKSWWDYGEDAQESVDITAKWGYSADVPARIKKAVYLYIGNELKNRSGTAITWLRKDFYAILRSYPKFSVV